MATSAMKLDNNVLMCVGVGVAAATLDKAQLLTMATCAVNHVEKTITITIT